MHSKITKWYQILLKDCTPDGMSHFGELQIADGAQAWMGVEPPIICGTTRRLHEYFPFFFFFFFFGPRLTHHGFLNPHKFHLRSSKFERLANRDITALPSTLASQVFTDTFLSANKLMRILQHYVLWQDSTLGARFKEQLHSSWHSYTCSSLHSEQPRRFKQFQPYSFWWLSWLFSV